MSTQSTTDLADSSQTDEFVTLLTKHQDILLSFIRSSIGDLATAKDVLQEVNLILWKKSGDFKMGTNFRAWAMKIARYQILGNYRDKQRSRLVFDDELVSQLAAEAEHVEDDWERDQRLKALEICISQLPQKQREILDSRYKGGKSIRDLASALESSTSRLKMILFRARKSLRDCILSHSGSNAYGEEVHS